VNFAGPLVVCITFWNVITMERLNTLAVRNFLICSNAKCRYACDRNDKHFNGHSNLVNLTMFEAACIIINCIVTLSDVNVLYFAK
jgi:hypothetical protein